MTVQNDKLLPGKYMVVHSRTLEGSCPQRLGTKLPQDECYMSPAYIKRLLQSVGLLGRIPIVVISDFQNRNIIKLLQQDAEIGKDVVVPSLDIHGWTNDTHPATDMMIAIQSNVFVGTRVSTMALMISLARVVTDKDPSTNLVYVDRELNVCHECIYYCNSKQTTICGGQG